MEAPILSFALKLSPFIGPFYFLCCSFAKQAKSCFPIANEQYLSFILANLSARVVSTLNKTPFPSRDGVWESSTLHTDDDDDGDDDGGWSFPRDG